MAVQKSRVPPSRRGMRRAHDALAKPALSIEPGSGETHRRHHVVNGNYRGKKVQLTTKLAKKLGVTD